MRVHVLLFAAAREMAGADRLDLDLSEGATVGQLRLHLAKQFPQLATLLGNVVFAVNLEYAADAMPLDEGLEVACIPPVSGG